tara:strand:+ start:4021 stop:4200 length:180 start_codon:yes stop_codon:yes gene_type:complete
MGIEIPPAPRKKRLKPAPKEDRTQVRFGDSKFSNYLFLGVTIAFIFSGLLIFVIKLCTN